MDGDPDRYISYLLRAWTVDQNGGRIWRASLESSTTGERLGFPDLEALFVFLRRCTSSSCTSENSSPSDLHPGTAPGAP